MPNLNDIKIRTDKKYLVISKSTDFLSSAKRHIEEILNTSDVSDNKSLKNSMVFTSIIFKDGGFIKFSLYDKDTLSVCSYDVLLVDTMLYATEFIDINRFCIMSDIVCVDIESNAAIDVIMKEEGKIKNRQYDSTTYSDYGECPYCDFLVREIDKVCPRCGNPLDWHYTKEIILNRCKYHVLHTDNNICNTYGMLLRVFSVHDLMAMSEKEITDVYKFGTYYKKYFLDHIIEKYK